MPLAPWHGLTRAIAVFLQKEQLLAIDRTLSSSIGFNGCESVSLGARLLHTLTPQMQLSLGLHTVIRQT